MDDRETAVPAWHISGLAVWWVTNTWGGGSREATHGLQRLDQKLRAALRFGRQQPATSLWQGKDTSLWNGRKQLVNHLCYCHIYGSILFLTILDQDISVKELCFGLSVSIRCLPIRSAGPASLPVVQTGSIAWMVFSGFPLMCVKMEELEVLFQVFFHRVYDGTWFNLS